MEKFFKSISSEEVSLETSLWEELIPSSIEDKFLRWLFAFLSIHTSWESNVIAYNNLKDLNWLSDKNVDSDKLLNILTLSKVGLQNNRTKFISSFAKSYFQDPDKYDLSNKDIEYRYKLMNEVKGIGITKISFVSEMHAPLKLNSMLCIDTHMLKLFSLSDIKLKTKVGLKEYTTAENLWHNLCLEYKIPSFIARSIYWNRVQKQTTSNYWAYCLK